MCNLYKMSNSATEIARLFKAQESAAGGNRAEQVYPGRPGLVVTEGSVRQMNWGFPLVLRGKQGQPLKARPVNNARTDKLSGSFWRSSFADRRCLIPVSAYAEAEGAKGNKTRTWISLPESEVFACAGLWRDSGEWGPSYAMVMTEASEAVASVHERMPVIVAQDDWTDYLGAPPDRAMELCRPWQGAIAIDRTDEAWIKKGPVS